MAQLASATLLGSDARAWVSGAGAALRISNRLDSVSATPSATTEDDTSLEDEITLTKAHSITSNVELAGRLRGDATDAELYHLLGDANHHPTCLSLAISGEEVGLRMRIYQAIGTGFSLTTTREALQAFTISGEQAGDQLDGVMFPPNEITGYTQGDPALTATTLSADKQVAITHNSRSDLSGWQNYTFRNTGAFQHTTGERNAFFLRVLSTTNIPSHHEPEIRVNRGRPTFTTKTLVITDESGIATDPIHLPSALTNQEWIAQVNAALTDAGITGITASEVSGSATTIQIAGSASDNTFTLAGSWAEFYAVDDTYTGGVSYLELASRTGNSRNILASYPLHPGNSTNDQIYVVINDGAIAGFSARLRVPTLEVGDPTPNATINTTSILVRSP